MVNLNRYIGDEEDVAICQKYNIPKVNMDLVQNIGELMSKDFLNPNIEYLSRHVGRLEYPFTHNDITWADNIINEYREKFILNEEDANRWFSSLKRSSQSVAVRLYRILYMIIQNKLLLYLEKSNYHSIGDDVLLDIINNLCLYGYGGYQKIKEGFNPLEYTEEIHPIFEYLSLSPLSHLSPLSPLSPLSSRTLDSY